MTVTSLEVQTHKCVTTAGRGGFSVYCACANVCVSKCVFVIRWTADAGAQNVGHNQLSQQGVSLPSDWSASPQGESLSLLAGRWLPGCWEVERVIVGAHT